MWDATATGRAGGTGEIMAAIDRSEAVAQYVIADLSCDGAWLAMPAAAACSLPAWR